MIKTAVIPVAGFGTRMLPASKSIAKELLPLADRPVIDYVIEECLLAGIEHVVLVTHSSKTSIEDFFDRNYELENLLLKAKKLDAYESLVKSSTAEIRISAVRQGQSKGLGHAILQAKHVIGDNPFAVLLPDVIVSRSSKNAYNIPMLEMIKQYNRTSNSQILVEKVPDELVSNYGIVSLSSDNISLNSSLPMSGIVEKPDIGNSPSNLAVVGRYVFSSRIWKHLENTVEGVGGEIQLTDAILSLLQEEAVYAVKLRGKSSDCGCKLGYYQAFVEQILQKGDATSEAFMSFINELAIKQQKLTPISDEEKVGKMTSDSIRLVG